MKKILLRVATLSFTIALGTSAPSCKGAKTSSAGVPACDCCESLSFGLEVKHCVAVLACEGDAQCPAGTACTTAFSDVPDRKTLVPEAYRACAATTVDNQFCGTVGAVIGIESALISGFGVDELSLSKVKPADGTVEIHWVAPPEATIVGCAIFGCAPSVGPSATTTDLQEKPLSEITNYDRCVLHADAFDAAQSTFALGLLPPSATTQPGPRASTRLADLVCAGSDDSLLDAQRPVLTTLAVGCWAYDTAQIIRASRLVNVDPEDLPPDNRLIRAICTEDPPTEGWSCLLAKKDLLVDESRVLGTCHAGRCARRCVNSRECPLATPPHDAGAGGAATGTGGTGGALPTNLACLPLPDHYLGVCDEPASDTSTGGAPP